MNLRNLITNKDVIKSIEIYRDGRGRFRKYAPGVDAETGEIKQLMVLTDSFRRYGDDRTTKQFDNLEDFKSDEPKSLDDDQLFVVTEILVKNELNEKRDKNSATSKALKKLEDAFNKQGVSLTFFLRCKANNVYSKQVVDSMYKSGDEKRAEAVMKCYMQAKNSVVDMIPLDHFVKELFIDPNVTKETKDLIDRKKLSKENFRLLCNKRNMAKEMIVSLDKLNQVKFNYLPKKEAEKFALTHPEYVDRLLALMPKLCRVLPSQNLEANLALIINTVTLNPGVLIDFFEKMTEEKNQKLSSKNIPAVCAALQHDPVVVSKTILALKDLKADGESSYDEKSETLNARTGGTYFHSFSEDYPIDNNNNLAVFCEQITAVNAPQVSKVVEFFERINNDKIEMAKDPTNILNDLTTKYKHIFLAAVKHAQLIDVVAPLYDLFKPEKFRYSWSDEKNFIFLEMLLKNTEALSKLQAVLSQLDYISQMTNAPNFTYTENRRKIFDELIQHKDKLDIVIQILNVLIKISTSSDSENEQKRHPLHYDFALVNLTLNDLLINPAAVLKNFDMYDLDLMRVASPLIFTHADAFNLPICHIMVVALDRGGIIQEGHNQELKDILALPFRKQAMEEFCIRLKLVSDAETLLVDVKAYKKTEDDYDGDLFNSFNFSENPSLKKAHFNASLTRRIDNNRNVVQKCIENLRVDKTLHSKWAEAARSEEEEAQSIDARQITLLIAEAFINSLRYAHDINTLITSYLYVLDSVRIIVPRFQQLAGDETPSTALVVSSAGATDAVLSDAKSSTLFGKKDTENFKKIIGSPYFQEFSAKTAREQKKYIDDAMKDTKGEVGITTHMITTCIKEFLENTLEGIKIHTASIAPKKGVAPAAGFTAGEGWDPKEALETLVDDKGGYNEANYVCFTIATLGGTHAVAIVIDKRRDELFIVDPLANHLGQNDAITKIQFAKKDIPKLKKLTIVTPPDFVDQQSDPNSCGVYDFLNTVGIIAARERKEIVLKNPGSDESVFLGVTVSSGEGLVGRSPECLDNVLGAMTVIYEHAMAKEMTAAPKKTP